MKYFRVILVLITILVLSCNDSDVVKPGELVKAEIKPLEVGNSWKYKITFYNDKGEIKGTEEITYLIESATEINGEKWYIERHGNSIPSVTIKLTNRDISGLWQLSGNNDFPSDSPNVIIPYPVEIGHEFEVNKFIDNDGDTINIIRKAVNIGDRVRINAGEFECIRYEDYHETALYGRKKEPINILFYAPKFGLIKSLLFRQGDDGEYELSRKYELQSYLILPD